MLQKDRSDGRCKDIGEVLFFESNFSKRNDAMQGNVLEADRQVARKAICSALGEEAGYLLKLINGDDALLAECLELVKRNAGSASISQWLHVRKGIIERSQAFNFCEAVLNLSLRRDRLTHT